MDEIFIPIAVIGFTLTVLSPYFFNRFTKYKIEIEKMKLESEIRKEEIRAKNQFDIEKYMADEQLKSSRIQAKSGASQTGGEDTITGINAPAQQQYTESDMLKNTGYAAMQPDFADIGIRPSNSAISQETGLPSEGRGREKLRY